jgi:hypothetical protein
MRTLVGILVVAALAGCNSGGGEAKEGSERGPCYGNGTCNDGLVCLSELCVRPPGADCAKIAEKLGGLLLGNYAPRAERDAFLAATRDECAALALTEEEGECLLGASHRNALSRCPKVIGVGDCGKIVAHLETLRTDPYLVTAVDRLQSRCKNETPSKGLETCVLAAKAVADLDRCVW